jgi:thiamine transporter ThiT
LVSGVVLVVDVAVVVAAAAVVLCLLRLYKLHCFGSLSLSFMVVA